MAALTRPTEASYVTHERVTVDTTDREDHTFCGIMFPIKCKDILPVAQVVINSIAVRGALGPITVWVTNDDSSTASGTTESNAHRKPAKNRNFGRVYNLRNVVPLVNKRRSNAVSTSAERNQTSKISLKPCHWTKIYSHTHGQSYTDYTCLDISSSPIVLKPNQVRGIYIHSTLDGDQAIVYDNRHKEKTHDDTFITVLPGRAHVSSEPFGAVPLWGYGSAWRDNREFVGKISYGVVYRLWNPHEYKSFAGNKFRNIVRTIFACQRRWESPLSLLPDDVIYYILNMCRWDWVGDGYEDCLEHKKKCRRECNRKKATILSNGSEGEVAIKNNCVVSVKSDSIACDSAKSTGLQGKQAIGSGGNNVNKRDSCDNVDNNDDADSDDDDYNGNEDSEDISDSDSDSESDMHYHGDHTNSNTFHFTNADDCLSSDDENAAAQERVREEGRRRRWMRHNHGIIFQQLGGLRAHFMSNVLANVDDSDGDDDA